MNIILLGKPGAGKGVQARLLQDRYHMARISTGDLLRDEVKRQTPIGLQVKEAMDAGLLPSDDIVFQIFENRLMQVKEQGVILDGIPRNLNQAQKIDEIFKRLGIVLDAVVQISVDDDELIHRLSTRVICKKCGTSYSAELTTRIEGICDKCGSGDLVRRPDDEPDAIKTRLDVYNEQTKPLIEYYSKTDRLRVVDGMKPVEEVSAQIESLYSKEFKVCSREIIERGKCSSGKHDERCQPHDRGRGPMGNLPGA
jgi:adenylate kinase